MIPTCSFPAAYAEGDSGWAVTVLQWNVNSWRQLDNLNTLIVEDGSYGGRTERAVRTIQRRRGLKVDGVCGPRTQTRMGLDLLTPAAEKAGIPRCVLRGLTQLESGFFVAAVNCQTEGGLDCGWCQIRVSNGASQTRYREVFSPSCFKETAERLVERQKQYGGSLDYAIVSWNWPAAAARYADGTINSWVYTSRDKQYRMDDPAPWIVEKDIDGVTTGHDWTRFYRERVKRFC